MAKPDDPFSMLELLFGLPNVRVLPVSRIGEVLEIHWKRRNRTDPPRTVNRAFNNRDRPELLREATN